MELLLELLWDSYRASLFFSLDSEIVWLSLLILDQTHILPATFLAVCASSLAFLTNYLLGAFVAGKVTDLTENRERYARAQEFSRNYFVWLFLFAWIPLLPLFSVFMGFFRPGWRRFMFCIVAGRMFYYGYYLMQHGVI